MERYRGAAFPGFEGHLFTAQFNARKVVRHQLIRSGPTFRSVDADFITTEDPDVHFSDVLEDADGSLLAVDTGSWYTHHCPTGRIRHAPATGGLWRVRHADTPRHPDPRGHKLEWSAASVPDLTRRLNDPRHAVRERAQLELGRRTNAVSALADCLQTNRDEFVRAAAAWALGNQADERGHRVLRERLRDANDPLAPLLARIVGRWADREAEAALQSWLSEPRMDLRMAAAEALAHCGSSASTDNLLAALADSPTPFLEHALQFALEHVASTASLEAALNHSSPFVQRAALLVLDQSSRSALTAKTLVARLDAADESVRATAQRLWQRHPEWAPEARAVIHRLLTAETLREGQPELLRWLVQRFAADPIVSASLAEAARCNVVARQTRALLAMLNAPVRAWPASWRDALAAAFRSEAPEVRHAAVRLAATQTSTAWDKSLAELVARTNELLGCRLEALRAVVHRETKFDLARLELLEACFAPTNPVAMRLSAMAVLTAGQPTAAQLARIADVVRPDNLVAPAAFIALAQKTPMSPADAGPLLDFASARIERGWHLSTEQVEWLLGISRDGVKEKRERLLRAVAARAGEQLQQPADYLHLLTGGDAGRGQLIFEGKAFCSACHRVGAAGGVVGPDLTKIGAIRAGRDLVESIVWPSASFAQSYETFVATLPDGESVTGIRVPGADDTIVLRDAAGHETRLPGNAPLERARVSLMPEGLLGSLNPGEIRDLFAYLQSLR
jgi:putative heme-binding domain-containing protein